MEIVVNVESVCRKKKVTFVCGNDETIHSIKNKAVGEHLAETMDGFVFLYNGEIVKNENKKISSFGRKEMTLNVKSNKECDSVEETPIENNFVEDSTKKEEFLVKEGVKYVIQERSKKLNVFQKLKMKRQLFKQHVRNVLKKYMTSMNVNIVLLLMFLFRFNKNMLCFVCFLKIATEFNKLIGKNSDLMDSITHTGKTMIYFVSSLFLIDHHKFFTRQQKTNK